MIENHDDLSQFERAVARAAPLSAAGEGRRHAMRTMLTARVVHRRRVRRAAQAALAAGVLVALGTAARLLLQPAVGPSPSAAPVPVAFLHADFAAERGDSARVATWCVRGDTATMHLDFTTARRDESAIAAMLAPPSRPSATLLDDAEVLRLLAGADRPTGLVRTGASVYFTGDVFDRLTELE